MLETEIKSWSSFIQRKGRVEHEWRFLVIDSVGTSVWRVFVLLRDQLWLHPCNCTWSLNYDMIDLCIQSKGGDRNLNRIGYVVHPINIDSDGMVSEQALGRFTHVTFMHSYDLYHSTRSGIKDGSNTKSLSERIEDYNIVHYHLWLIFKYAVCFNFPFVLHTMMLRDCSWDCA